MALNYVNYIPSTRCLSSLKCVYGFSLCADSEAWSAFKPSGRDRSICCCFYRFLSISLPPVPNRERSSPFLAQLSRQLNIGIDFQSSASVAKLAEGLSSTVSSVTGLQRCMHPLLTVEPDQYVRYRVNFAQGSSNRAGTYDSSGESGVWQGSSIVFDFKNSDYYTLIDVFVLDRMFESIMFLEFDFLSNKNLL